MKTYYKIKIILEERNIDDDSNVCEQADIIEFNTKIPDLEKDEIVYKLIAKLQQMIVEESLLLKIKEVNNGMD